MPSNAELIKEADELAAKLGTPVETKDLSNDKLVDLVRDLRAKVTDAETQTQADNDKARKAARMENKVKKEKKPPFYVAPGKSLTSKKGILSGDTSDEVKAEYLRGGKEALDAFVKSGHVLKG